MAIIKLKHLSPELQESLKKLDTIEALEGSVKSLLERGKETLASIPNVMEELKKTFSTDIDKRFNENKISMIEDIYNKVMEEAKFTIERMELHNSTVVGDTIVPTLSNGPGFQELSKQIRVLSRTTLTDKALGPIRRSIEEMNTALKTIDGITSQHKELLTAIKDVYKAVDKHNETIQQLDDKYSKKYMDLINNFKKFKNNTQTINKTMSDAISNYQESVDKKLISYEKKQSDLDLILKQNRSNDAVISKGIANLFNAIGKPLDITTYTKQSTERVLNDEIVELFVGETVVVSNDASIYHAITPTGVIDFDYHLVLKSLDLVELFSVRPIVTYSNGFFYIYTWAGCQLIRLNPVDGKAEILDIDTQVLERLGRQIESVQIIKDRPVFIGRDYITFQMNDGNLMVKKIKPWSKFFLMETKTSFVFMTEYDHLEFSEEINDTIDVDPRFLRMIQRIGIDSIYSIEISDNMMYIHFKDESYKKLTISYPAYRVYKNEDINYLRIGDVEPFTNKYLLEYNNYKISHMMKIIGETEITGSILEVGVEYLTELDIEDDMPDSLSGNIIINYTLTDPYNNRNMWVFTPTIPLLVDESIANKINKK